MKRVRDIIRSIVQAENAGVEENGRFVLSGKYRERSLSDIVTRCFILSPKKIYRSWSAATANRFRNLLRIFTGLQTACLCSDAISAYSGCRSGKQTTNSRLRWLLQMAPLKKSGSGFSEIIAAKTAIIPLFCRIFHNFLE